MQFDRHPSSSKRQKTYFFHYISQNATLVPIVSSIMSMFPGHVIEPPVNDLRVTAGLSGAWHDAAPSTRLIKKAPLERRSSARRPGRYSSEDRLRPSTRGQQEGRFKGGGDTSSALLCPPASWRGGTSGHDLVHQVVHLCGRSRGRRKGVNPPAGLSRHHHPPTLWTARLRRTPCPRPL